MKKPIKIGGGPWQSGSPTPKPKAPIKSNQQNWNQLPPEEKPKAPIKSNQQNWNQLPPEEKPKAPIKTNQQTWNQLPTNEIKKDVSTDSKMVKVQPNKWETVEKTDTGPTKREVNFKTNEWGKLPEAERKTETLKLEPVKMETSQWDALSGLQEPNVIRQFEGINGLNAFAIKDTHATRNKNVTTSRYPALAVRNGGAVLTSTITTEIDGIGVRGTELHVISNGIWSKYVGGTWTQLKTGLNTTKKWTFVNFQGNFANNSLLASNGVDAALKYDGTTVSNLANAPALTNFITTHDNRVYLAVKSTVYFSALRKAEDWSTVNDSGSIVVETSDGQDITGLIAGSSRLTVFKQNSIHELFGNSPSNYQMKIVTDNLGSPTGNTAQVIDGTIYFLGNDAVYRYSGGSLPSSDFSIQVRDSLSKINKAASDQSVSWHVGKKYYLAFPTGSNTNPDTVLEYDLEFNSWNTWSFPSPITAKGAVLSDIAYIGCANGNLYKLDNSATTDNGTAIAWEWVSKPFTFNSLAAKSRWYRMWVVADIPTGATLNVHVSGDEDGENWTLVQSITANTNIQAKEIRIPTTLVNNSNFVRVRLEGTGQVVVYEVSRQERVFPFGQN